MSEQRRSVVRVVPVAMAVLVLSVVGGTGGWGEPRGKDAQGGAAGGMGGTLPKLNMDALLPTRVSVHPLTRIGADRDGVESLIVHVELKDQFGHATKALGRLRIELYKPGAEGGDGGGGGGVQDRVWNLDLTDPAVNAGSWDELVTRTYTVYLGGLPQWLTEWKAAGEDGGGSGGTVQVTFVTADTRGNERVLNTSHRLRK